ncbi:GNAT family N-acetyltransferase [Halorussus amylolyticus]|uniref:GNAT family N-acetyltransferase n=1 Tax=Halorussus amylolyticus TaxID=1126242 RepID=UPI00105187F5|nr:GNAT family N-acetyltransferase [Halorussus amylolyticus]
MGGRGEYTIEQYEECDTSAFCELFQTEWYEVDEEWVQWRYFGPYADDEYFVVARENGRLVGFLPCMTFPIRANGEDELALQPAGLFVHPDHRGRGVFTRLTERLVERCADAEPSVFFNFPTDAAVHGFEKHGWQVAKEVPSYFRIQNPGAVLRHRGHDMGATATAAFRAASTAYFDECRRFGSSACDATVTRHSDVPAADLASLYAEDPPREIHVPRDPTFYRWRYDAPGWNYAAYVVRDGGPVAGAVVASDTLETGLLMTAILETQPMGATDRDGAFERLLAAILADHRETDVFWATKSTLPRSVALSHGFLGDDEPPFWWFRRPLTMVARPVTADPESWQLHGRRLTDAADWRLTLCEWDPPLFEPNNCPVRDC